MNRPGYPPFVPTLILGMVGGDKTVMDTSQDDTELLDELEIVSEMIRTRTKRLYKDSEILWRLGAKQEDLVKQLRLRHPKDGTHGN